MAVEPSGNIISVCHHDDDKRTRGRHLIAKAVENGGDRLDAFGEVLYNFYTKNGFEPVSWTPFNREYAPEGWKPEYGEDPVIFYKHTNKNYTEPYQDFLDRVKPDSDYDTAKNKRDKEI